MCAGAQAPGTFTTGSDRVPTGSEAMQFLECALGPGPQAHLPRVPNGFPRVPGQCTFHNACRGPGPKHIHHRFPTGSNGFRGNALFIVRAGAHRPQTHLAWVPTGSEAMHFSYNACWRPGLRHIYHGFRMGSNEFRGSALLKMRAGAWVPGTPYHWPRTGSN